MYLSSYDLNFGSTPCYLQGGQIFCLDGKCTPIAGDKNKFQSQECL